MAEYDWIGAVIDTGLSLYGASRSASGAKDAAATAAGGSAAELNLIRESRDLARADQEPYRLAGYEALDALRSMTGLGGPQRGRAPGPANSVGAGRGGGGRDLGTWDGGRGGGMSGPRQDMGGGGGSGWPGSSGGSSWAGVSGSPWTGFGLKSTGSDGGGAAMSNEDWVRLWHSLTKSSKKVLTGGRNEGGPISGKIYNVHETGNENIYTNGSYTRGHGPSTIDGKTGYVEPNTQSRYGGGYIEGRQEGVLLGGAYSGPLGVTDPRPEQIPGGSDDKNLDGGQYGRYDYPKQQRPPVTQVPPTTGAPPPPNSTVGPPNNAPPDGFPRENPGGVEGGYNFMTDPGYAFRFGEGIRAMDRSASASGGLLSGGYGRKLTRYGQDYASNEYTNVYNRISNIAGLGQVATNQSGQYALNAGAGMGTAAAQGAQATAYGQQAGTNAWANAANQIGQIDWGSIFGNNNQQQPYGWDEVG